MVKISDCSCECRDRGRERQIEERALSSINKVLGTEGQAYYPDGTGAVTIPVADADQLAQIDVNSRDIKQMKISIAEDSETIETQAIAIDAHARAIASLQTSDAQHTSDIREIRDEAEALARELPTSLTLYRASTGKIQLQYEREDMTDLDSNILDMVIPYQYELLPGASSRSFRLSIIFSDGSRGQTNDFLIPAGGGTDVSVTGITLTKDPTDANRFKAQILLDDGTPLDSGYLDMVTSVSGSFANNRLTISVNGRTSLPIAIDTQGTTYTPGNGIVISGGTISVDSTVVALKTDIQDMATKTEVAGTYATKASVAQLQASVGDAFDDVDFDSETGSLTFTAIDGQQNSLALTTELVWEAIAPADIAQQSSWHVGDQWVGGLLTFTGTSGITQLEQISMLCVSAGSQASFIGTASSHQVGQTQLTSIRQLYIADGVITGVDILGTSVTFGNLVTSGGAASAAGYRTTQSTISGDKTASTISTCADLVSKARIGDTIVAPTVEVTQATIEDTPIHVVTSSGSVQAGSTIYINSLEMTVISRSTGTIVANGYGRYSYTTTSGSKSETTIQQIKITSDGAIEVLVAGTWTISKTVGTASKFSMLLIR